ncbi:hypothetical protein BASA61_008283 [Batrachochytrium salamandrivorans]|nr:hypothetical protein BASA61_008283 [Batrachochytrium salamandrivorans]KAH9270915.1 hypothetical protein BASA83_006868 [Batrachochytrium salamandrivorans]
MPQGITASKRADVSGAHIEYGDTFICDNSATNEEDYISRVDVNSASNPLKNTGQYQRHGSQELAQTTLAIDTRGLDSIYTPDESAIRLTGDHNTVKISSTILKDNISGGPCPRNMATYIVRSQDCTSPISADPTNTAPKPISVKGLFFVPQLNLARINKAHSPKALIQRYSINTTTLCDVAAAICILRTVLIFQAEFPSVTLLAVRNFFLIFVPFQLFIYQAIHQHDPMFAKAGITHHLFTCIRLLILFGLAWTAPSVFVVSGDASTAFFMMLVIGKCAIFIMSILVALFGPVHFASLLVRSLLVLTPIGFWIASVWVSAVDQHIMFLKIGVCVDISSCLIIDALDVWNGEYGKSAHYNRIDNATHAPPLSMTGHCSTSTSSDSVASRDALRSHQLGTRLTMYTTALIISGAIYLFPHRDGVTYPDMLVAVKFNVYNFLFGSSGLAILFSIHAIYTVVCGWCVLHPLCSPESSKKGSTTGKKPKVIDPIASQHFKPNPIGGTEPQADLDSIEYKVPDTTVIKNPEHPQTCCVNILDSTESHNPNPAKLHCYQSVMLSKLMQWIHMVLHAAIVVLIAGIQLHLSKTSQLSTGYSYSIYRFPVDISLPTDFSGTKTIFNVTGVDYLTAILTLSSNSTVLLGTSRLTSMPTWPPISIILLCSGVCVIVLALMGIVSVKMVMAHQKHDPKTLGQNSLYSLIGHATLLRLIVGISVTVTGYVVATHNQSISDTVLFLGMTGVFVVMCIAEKSRKMLSPAVI